MISKKIKYLKEPLDIDLQLLASELDTSVNNMKYLCKNDMTDAILIEAFDKLVDTIEKIEGVEITSFDDNTILYEFLDEAVIIHNVLGVKYILFDNIITSKIEIVLHNYI